MLSMKMQLLGTALNALARTIRDTQDNRLMTGVSYPDQDRAANTNHNMCAFFFLGGQRCKGVDLLWLLGKHD